MNDLPAASLLQQIHPFHVVCDRKGRILSHGRSLEKAVPGLKVGAILWDLLTLVSPQLGVRERSFEGLFGELCVMKVSSLGPGSELVLRGELVQEGDAIIIPFSTSMLEAHSITAHRLDFNDFAISDPIFDLMLLLQTERRTHLELRNSLAREKVALSKAAAASRLSALGEFSAGIAHEIKNPPSVIQMACEQFLDTPAPSPERATVIIRRALNACFRIGKIVSGLRTYSRDGSLDGFAEADASAILEDTLLLCKKRFMEHGIDLQVAAPERKILLECNAIQVSQVLMNLLGNALDSVTTRAAPWVKIELAATDSRVTYRVTDSGPPIPKDIADRIMEPFFTTKPVGQGTGLGLSISLGIAQAHRGSLQLDPCGDHPSFVLDLPRQQVQSAPPRPSLS